MSQNQKQDLSLNDIMAKAITLPGVKVDRNKFLVDLFSRDVINMRDLIDRDSLGIGSMRDVLKTKADKLVQDRTSQSSILSFLAGLPGGLAMAATIPADVLQFFGVTLRMAQELFYLYGGEDLWSNGDTPDENARLQLILTHGVMFEVSGAEAGLRLLTSKFARDPSVRQPVNPSFWAPVVRKIEKEIVDKMTRGGVAKSLAKFIPVIGGLVSGGLTFATMKPMGSQLASVLDEAVFSYTEENFMADYETLKEMAQEEEESGEDFEPEEEEPVRIEEPEPAEANVPESDPFDALVKLSKLKDMGIITEEEFSEKKKELLAKLK